MIFIQIALSFVIGGVVIAAQTLIGERVSPGVRGLILTIPSTSAVSFFFIGLTTSPTHVIGATTTFIAALAPCYIFIASFAFLSQKHNLISNLIVSYGIWAVIAFFILTIPPKNFLISIFLYCLPIIFLSYSATKKIKTTNSIRPVPFSWQNTLMRSLLAGTIILTAVTLSKTLGPTWGGLFAAFPAAFTSTLLIYYFEHGKEAIASAAQTLFFPGIFSFIIYATAARLLFPPLGIWWGTLLSYVCVFLLYYPLYQRNRKLGNGL